MDNDWMKKPLWEQTSAERQLAKPIEKPWLYETDKPITEPPDINYRRRILQDQDVIDRLFEDENLHFTERCLQYQEQDVVIEYQLLRDYRDWNLKMLEHATLTGGGPREDFFEGLTEAVGEDCGIVTEEWWKHQHGTYEREERRKGRTDFKAGIDACYCADCNNIRTIIEARHEELKEEAERTGATHFWKGVPDCPCNACRMAPHYRAQHKKKKREALLSGASVGEALRWCGCVKCGLKRQSEHARHKELKDEAKQNGTAYFISGIPGCPCNYCWTRQQNRTEHKEKKKAALRSSSSVEEALQDCSCIKCTFIRLYGDGSRDPEYIYWHGVGPSPDESEAEDEESDTNNDKKTNTTTQPTIPSNEHPPTTTLPPNDPANNLPPASPSPKPRASRIPVPIYAATDNGHASKRRATSDPAPELVGEQGQEGDVEEEEEEEDEGPREEEPEMSKCVAS